jgi:hypothetical protein
MRRRRIAERTSAQLAMDSVAVQLSKLRKQDVDERDFLLVSNLWMCAEPKFQVPFNFCPCNLAQSIRCWSHDFCRIV